MQPSPRALLLLTAGLLPAVLPSLTVPQVGVAWGVYFTLVVFACGLDALLSPRRDDLSVELQVPKQIPLGEEMWAEVRLQLPSDRPLDASVLLDLDELLEPQAPAELKIARGGTDVQVPLVAHRRGTASVEGAWVRYAGPLGLMLRTVHRPLQRKIIVVPSLQLVYRAALSFSSRNNDLRGLKIEKFRGDGSEFVALREHQPDFDPRSIDWKASARHTQLLSREFQAERNHQIIFALDTGRLMAEPLANLPRVDHAVHALLLLSYVCLRHGDRVSLFAFDERPHRFVAARGGVGALSSLVSATSDLVYSEAETNFTLGLTHLGQRLRRRSLIVVLTDFVDSVSAELMVDNVQRLAHRHLVIFVALRDPLLGSLVTTAPQSLLDVERSVVADSLVQERELVLQRLRRAGILCVDTPPEHLGPDLLNRYLQVKRREMI